VIIKENEVCGTHSKYGAENKFKQNFSETFIKDATWENFKVDANILLVPTELIV
jgi:hypothetical protein